MQYALLSPRVQSRLALATFGFLALAGSGLALASARQAQSSAPPSELWHHPESGISFFGDDLETTFTYDTAGKSVRASFIVSAMTPSTGGNGPVERYSGAVDFPLRYWPTAITQVDDHKIAIAGKVQSGLTVIEIHEFLPATLTWHVPVGGQGSWNRTAVRRVSITSVLSTSEPDQDMVACMFPQLGQDPTQYLLVQFWSSKDIYSVELATGQLSMVLDSAVEPQLDQDFDLFVFGEHMTEGFVYVMAREEGDGLLLIDADRSGSIDSRLWLDGPAWGASVFANGDLWVQSL